MTTEAEYGSWKSPLTSKLACDSSVSITGIFVDPETPGYAMFFLHHVNLKISYNGFEAIYAPGLTIT